MKINEIYNKYQITEDLKDHMYRVAAVGSLIVDFMKDNLSLEKDLVIKTLLLHDIGNIIKFNFQNNKLIKEEEVEKYKKIQEFFISKYGDDEHIATQNILKETGVNQKVIDILDNIGSSKIQSTIDSDDWYKKVCSYSDFRVAPYGVTSVEERFNDVIERYKGGKHILGDVEKTEQKKIDALTLESQIQEKCSSSLILISDEKIKNIIEQLKEYEIN